MRRTFSVCVILMTLALSLSLFADDKKPAAPAAESVESMVRAGLDLEKNNQTAEAEAKFREAVAAAQKFVEAETADLGMYCNLGLAYLKLKDYTASEQSYKKAIDSYPSSTVPYEGLVALYDAQGEYGKAMDELAEAAKLDPAENDKLFAYAFDKGSGYFESKDYEKAEPFLQKAIEIKPEDPQANLGLAQCFEFQKKYADAVPFFEKAASLLPDDDITKPALMLKTTKCQYFGKLYKEAVASAEKLLEMRPNNEQALMFRAASYMELKDCENSVPAAESFLAVSKNNAVRLSMLKGIGRCQYDQKKYKNAVATYEKVLALDANDEDALLYSGNSYIQLKNNAKALPLFKKLVQVTKDAGLKASAKKTVRQLGG